MDFATKVPQWYHKVCTNYHNESINGMFFFFLIVDMPYTQAHPTDPYAPLWMY